MDPTLPALPVELTWQSVVIFLIGLAVQYCAGKFTSKPTPTPTPPPVAPIVVPPIVVDPAAEPRIGDGHLLRALLPVLLQLAGVAARVAPLVMEKPSDPPKPVDPPKPQNT